MTDPTASSPSRALRGRDVLALSPCLEGGVGPAPIGRSVESTQTDEAPSPSGKAGRTVVLPDQPVGIESRSAQFAVLRELRRRDPRIQVSWALGTDPAPTFLSGDLSSPVASSPLDAARDFLAANAALYGIRDLDRELALNESRSILDGDKIGFTHVQFDQVLGGLPVYQRSLTVHMRPDGAVSAVNGQFVGGLDPAIVPARPAFPVASVRGVVADHAGVHADFDRFEEPELVVSLHGKSPMACWKTDVLSVRERISRTYLVNAETGGVEDVLERNHASRGGVPARGEGIDPFGRRIQLEGEFIDGVYTLCDDTRGLEIATVDHFGESLNEAVILPPVTDPDNSWDARSQASSVNAHSNMGRAVDYYRTALGRNSWDDRGGSVQVGVRDGLVDNAYSLGDGFFGFGDGSGGRPWSMMDVASHEFTHAVVGATSALIYRNESGAANESFADIFGTFAEARMGNSQGVWNWRMGEDINGQGIRDISNPQLFGHPDRYSELYRGTQDAGGVHTNSGILNKAAFLLTQGGTHPDTGVQVTGIGLEHAELAYYRAMTLYLFPNASFTDVRAAVVTSVDDYVRAQGWSAAETDSARRAYDAVEVGGTPNAPGGPNATFAAVDVPIAIPDADVNGIFSQIIIGQIQPWRDARVSVRIRHTYPQDLVVALFSLQTFDVVYLHYGEAGSGAGIDATYEVPAGFNGGDTYGAWVLAVQDYALFDAGVLEAWSLEFR